MEGPMAYVDPMICANNDTRINNRTGRSCFWMGVAVSAYTAIRLRDDIAIVEPAESPELVNE